MTFLEKIIFRIEGLFDTSKNVKALRLAFFEDRKNPKINIGQLQAELNKSKGGITSLSEVEFQVFSQFGDDGIIQWLVQQLPSLNKTFIEFGVENYRESNTRFLLVNNYWSGFVIDGSAANVNSIKGDQIYTFYDLQAQCSFITVENINQLLTIPKFAREAGILSIDIDGNDYWVLKAITTVEPAIIICEYNSLFGFEHPYTIQYKDDFVRGTAFPFHFYGTSIKSVYNLVKQKGYVFIGCNSAGNNAYFIKDKFMPSLSIREKSLKEGYNFAVFTEAYDKEKGDWIKGTGKIMSINNFPVINTETGALEKVDAPAIIKSLIENNKTRHF